MAETKPVSPPSDIEKLADAILARAPKTPEQQFMTDEQRRVINLPCQPRRYRIIPGHSLDTGSTFGLVVVEELDKAGKPHPAFPHGKIVNFRGYHHPKDLFIEQSNGGRWPDGLRVFFDGRPTADLDPDCAPTEGMTIRAKEHRRQHFYTYDHRATIGRALRASHCVEDGKGKGLDTPWAYPDTADAAAE